ncbi:MAG: DUF2087 domain-containing protein [Actinobacteria bacterium]|nr:DUF2087 domain-containing protein [Actinomycetota bacterium]
MLADEVRLRLVCHLVVNPGLDVGELADLVGLDGRSIASALDRLVHIGLVTRVSGRHEVDTGSFARSVRAAAALRPKEVRTPVADALRRYFQRGRLVAIPQVGEWGFEPVLRVLADSFELGVDVDEPEVNRRLLAWHPDYAALRRHLVDQGHLRRDHGTYRRVR